MAVRGLLVVFLNCALTWSVGELGAQSVLRITPSNGVVVVSWTNAPANVRLQQSASLAAPRWDTTPDQPRTLGDESQVAIPITENERFYRLATPLNHVLVVGQSLAMGAYADAILSTNQPFLNRMFVGQRLDGGLPGLLPDDLSALAPLVERWDPTQQGGETIASGFANWISSRVGVGVHDLLVSNTARGSATYAQLQRIPAGSPLQAPTGTDPYLRTLEQVEAAKGLLQDSGYLFRAIFAVHGEGDLFNSAYDLDIRQWQEDYEADIHGGTGQTNAIPMFHSQISTWGKIDYNWPRYSPFKVLTEFELNPSKTVLVCPKYMLPYLADAIHVTNIGYRWLGEYYAKAYYHHVILGESWSPLRPVEVTRTNTVITITFAGVVGRLVFDTNAVANPQGTIFDRHGSPVGDVAFAKVGPYGFEYCDEVGAGAPWSCSTYVASVSLMSSNRVAITLNQEPAGARRFIRYAYTALDVADGGQSGPLLGPRGCLRDTDPTPSICGNTLYNWCVHFDKACP